MKVAVEGCCHGELDNIYNRIATLEKQGSFKVDLLLICGDFQAIRNNDDLQCMAVPQKYKRLGGFHKYYTGEKVAPVLTLVIGGNHEASNYLWELYHGGWLAPNIYFLGFSGCVQVNGVRIAGSSGIYKRGDYFSGHYEKLPYNSSALRSIYHTRQYDVFKLSQLQSPNIFLSHDWPNTIERHGDIETLLKCKPFFREEVRTSSLGSPPMLELLKTLKPQWWFSAHLHVKFEALYSHNGDKQSRLPPNNPDEIVLDDIDDADPPIHDGNNQNTSHANNPDEIVVDDIDTELPAQNVDEIKASEENLDMESSSRMKPASASPLSDSNRQSSESSKTRFLALDKCLPRRDFLEIIDIPAPKAHDTPVVTFDPDWLAITRALHPYLCTTKEQVPLPEVNEARARIAKELEWVNSNLPDGGLCNINEVQSFWRTAPGPTTSPRQTRHNQLRWYTNPQTEALMQMLQIRNKVNSAPTEALPVIPSTVPLMKPDQEVEQGGKAVTAMTYNADAEQMEKNDNGSEDVRSSIVRDQGPISNGGWSPSRIVE